MSAARQVKAKAVKRRPLIRAASSAAIASGSRHVSLLVPSAGLPPEGEEFEWPVSFRPTGEFRQWIDVFRALCGDRAPRFHIRGTDVDLLSDLEDASVLHWVQMSFTEDDDLPQLEASPATACIDWSTVLGRVSERMHDPHFIPSPRELLRVFLEEMRAVVGVSARTFAGEGPDRVDGFAGDRIEIERFLLGLTDGNYGLCNQVQRNVGRRFPDAPRLIGRHINPRHQRGRRQYDQDLPKGPHRLCVEVFVLPRQFAHIRLLVAGGQLPDNGSVFIPGYRDAGDEVGHIRGAE